VKHIQFITPALALLAACSWAKAAPITTPEIAYSQDGIHFRSIPALAEPLAVEHFYRKTKAHTAPGFGTPANTDTVAVYFDKNDDTLSLMLVTGTKGENSGSTPMHMDGLPAAVTVFLSKSTNSVQRNVGAARLHRGRRGDFIHGARTGGFHHRPGDSSPGPGHQMAPRDRIGPENHVRASQPLVAAGARIDPHRTAPSSPICRRLE
jgi:hypothetical protein